MGPGTLPYQESLRPVLGLLPCVGISLPVPVLMCNPLFFLNICYWPSSMPPAFYSSDPKGWGSDSSIAAEVGCIQLYLFCQMES